jgi:UDP-N-acetylmuramate--alanine ligase
VSDSLFATTAGGGPVRIHKSLKAHLVGIAGAGMRSLADVLDDAGWVVTGSDLDARSLAGSPLNIRQGHHADSVHAGLDLVVHSDAVSEHNPELVQARKLNLSVLNYAGMLGRMMESRIGVAVAGTHGKSTTTAMAGEILAAGGFDPIVIYGAAPFGASSGGRFGRGRVLLAEACEYRSNFHQLKPQMAVILGIEPDHFDCFKSPADLERAFARFAARVPEDGLVLVNGECAATARALIERRSATESFGLGRSATWQATELRERYGFYSFQIRCRDRLVSQVKLHTPGKHNVLNALAAAALASHLGATGSVIRTGLEQFNGLQRRMQLLGEANQIAILDDYAHHPTAVTAALATARQMYPDRRLWCVFQPHQASRTRALIDPFADSLQNADKIIVAEVYRAREAPSPADAFVARELADRTAARGGDVVHLATAAEIHDHLKQSLSPGDVVMTLGAGDIGRIAHELGQGLRTYRQAG